MEILKSGKSTSSGIHLIDPDGAGGIPPFKAYCDMSHEGGGWTLFANHADGLVSITKKDTVAKNKYGVIENDKWMVLRNSMSEGMMFIDEFGRISTISAAKLNGGNCTKTSTVEDLSNAGLAAYNSAGGIWHNENSGCNIRGGDYSMVQLRGNSYKSFNMAGAALYQQSSVKYDKWPYKNNGASYDEQNKLLYFIK